MNKPFKTLFTLFLGVLLIISTFTANSAAETIEDIVESLGEIQEEFSKLSPSDNKEADIIDQAIKEINKSTEFALESINKEDTTTATLALSYVNKSLSDIGKIVPKEFESDMSNADIENFAPEKMETLKEITTAMNEKKQEDKNLLFDQIIELNDIGFNTTEISGRLASLGVDTVTMIELDNRKFDKIRNEIVDNQLEISSKEESLNSLKQQIEPLDSQSVSLNSEKQAITDKYNAELAKQAEDIDISDEDLNKSQKLAEQFNKEIENVSKQINTINSQSSSLTSKINALTEEIKTKTLASNDLNQKVTSLNSQLQNSKNLINSQQTALSQLQNSLAPTQDQLLALTKEKEVINTEVDNLLSKEISDYNKYAQFIGDTEDEVIMALRMVDSLLEPDPRKSRAFEYEVYAKIFDVSENQMKAGIQSILSGDYEGEKVAMVDWFSKLVNSNITSLGKDEFDQETINAFKNNPALIDQIAEESIRSYKTQDTAIYKIIDAAEKGIASADKDRFANEIRDILRSDPTMVEEGRIDNVYYDLLFNGPTEDSAAYAQVKLSNDSKIERAYYTASWNWSDDSKMKVAAQVVTQIFGTNEDERKYYKISFDSNMNPEEAKKQKFTEEERLQYFDKYGEFFGSTAEKFVSVNNKISELETVNATSLKEVTALSKEIEDVQAAEKQLQNQIVSFNTQIKENQNTITAAKTSLNDFEQQLTKSTTELQALNSNKSELSIKLDEHVAKVTKEQELTGKASVESLALKNEYEAELSILNQKISNIKAETKSINSSVSSINLELNQLRKIQEITATKAKELVPDASLSVQFNYANSSISKDAARVGAVSLGKSESDWANSWKGEVATTKIIEGNVVNLSADEIQSVKADLAMESAIHALATGEISKDLDIDTSEFSLATTLSASVMIETLQRQSTYLSIAISQGRHEMTSEAAMLGVKSLGKTQAEWAASWTGGKATGSNTRAYTAEEIQATHAEWAMNMAARAIQGGGKFIDASGAAMSDAMLTNIDQEFISQELIAQASVAATQAAMADVQKQVAEIAIQVSSAAEAVQNIDTSSVAEEVGEQLTGILAGSNWLSSQAAEESWADIGDVESYLGISVDAITQDTSSWTEAEWAASWVGAARATHHSVSGIGRVYHTAEEQQAIEAEWAKNRAATVKSRK